MEGSQPQETALDQILCGSIKTKLIGSYSYVVTSLCSILLCDQLCMNSVYITVYQIYNN